MIRMIYDMDDMDDRWYGWYVAYDIWYVWFNLWYACMIYDMDDRYYMYDMYDIWYVWYNVVWYDMIWYGVPEKPDAAVTHVYCNIMCAYIYIYTVYVSLHWCYIAFCCYFDFECQEDMV